MLPTTATLHQLQREGVVFEHPEQGTHVIVRTVTEVIHFWPSNRRWWIVGTRYKRGGVIRLAKYVKGKQPSQNRTIAPIYP